MDVRDVGALVTGGGSGMGAATARALAAAGAKVGVIDLNGDTADAVAKDIGGLGLVCDVGDAANAEAAVKQASAAHGPCRLLVNCAGIAPAKRIVGRDGPMDLAAFEAVIRVNLIGSFNMLRLAAAEMTGAEPLNEDGERGVIVSTSSVAATEGQVGQVAYAASKAGINGLNAPAARELGRFGVRVLSIAPGLIGTPLLLNMPEDVQENLAQQPIFPKRFGSPEEFADLVLHIAGNPMLNMETIRFDGGLRMA
ncbi:SDR family NAD(P)-dependent oxidoreductase [Algihabitans albus]|uniref:SDR family NAD(P)-dependent oxidoreductase n=1 Tax=Algihabitans albus TaxID=2164067 RepID=UPI000E5C943F|nr:SDR family NAD(P)-dependent oxidoreductase [Algihabitans albus]